LEIVVELYLLSNISISLIQTVLIRILDLSVSRDDFAVSRDDFCVSRDDFSVSLETIHRMVRLRKFSLQGPSLMTI
jgi:hypothetical protein